MKTRAAAVALLALALALSGCATQYPGPRTDATAQVDIATTGLQRHGAYPNDKLLVRVFLGKDVKGTELGMVTLSYDQPSGSLKLDQGQEYTIWINSIESHFGGFSSCGFHLPFNPVRDDRYTVNYATNKSTCNVSIDLTDRAGKVTHLGRASNVAGLTQFKASVTRYGPN